MVTMDLRSEFRPVWKIFEEAGDCVWSKLQKLRPKNEEENEAGTHGEGELTRLADNWYDDLIGKRLFDQSSGLNGFEFQRPLW
jgi:hypothetical protein